MRHLARRHDITYLSFAEPDQREEDRRGMSEVCTTLETVPRSDAAKRTFAVLRGRRAPRAEPAPVRRWQVSVGAVRGAGAPAPGGGRVRSARRRLPAAGGEPAGVAADPHRPLHAQRRGGDLAPPRGDGLEPADADADGRAVEAHAALRARGAHPGRSRARGLRRRPRHLRPPVSRRGAARHPRGADRRRYRRTSRRRRVPPGGRTWSSPGRWTGCRTKTACSTSCATSCRASVRSSRRSR